MGKVQVLPAQLANMIAAGEVVGRPASVVKELMENSIDAGASEVSVVVLDSGRTLIQVIDNGCGMGPEDAQLCFERHATSKISSPEDLEQILTFGFRGEALASIGAVAEITLKTRRAEDELATEVKVGMFGSRESCPTSAPVGTSIAVRNLFYNTPARRKFLKSDNVELKHIIDEFTHVALTRPDVAFSLKSNDRDIFVLKKAKSLKFRVQDLLGASVVGEIVDVQAQTSIVSISGFVGRPESAKKTLGNQFFFVNGRYFRSPYFHKAVMNAYEEMTPDGKTPSYLLYLEVDPHSIDVNISPTKTEIKFEDDSVIFQTIYACVRETLGRNSFGASIDFDTEGMVELPQFGASFSEYRTTPIAPSVDFDPDYNPFSPSPEAETPSWRPECQQDYGVLFEKKELPPVSSIILGGKYIATPVTSGMMLIHVRRALTRVLYEKMLTALRSERPLAQASLFPVEVQVGAAQVPLFEDHIGMFDRMGLKINIVSSDSIMVSGVPDGCGSDEMSIREMVYDLQNVLQEQRGALPEMLRSAVAAKMATSLAASYPALRSSAEAEKLLDDLFSCENAETVPSGRRITNIVPLEDIDKRF